MSIPSLTEAVLFDATTATRDQMIEEMRRWHRGNTGACQYVVGLINQIAQLRGFPEITLSEVEPDRTHLYVVKKFGSRESVVSYAAEHPEYNHVKYLGFHEAANGFFHFGVYAIGKAPDGDLVQKKMRQYGVKFAGG